MELKGKHAFVTGAGKRLGRVIAEALLKENVRLTAHYRTSRKECESLITPKASVFIVQADLRDNLSLQKAVQASVQAMGEIDILINCASDYFPTPAIDCTEEEWDKLQETNVRGQFFLAQACAPHMLEKGGAIINLVDINAERPARNYTPYVVSKAGLLMMTKNLAKEWAPRVRVNAVSPGTILLPENFSEEEKKKYTENIPLGRIGAPQDIAHGILFLLKNDYLTGFNLKIDGGRSLT